MRNGIAHASELAYDTTLAVVPLLVFVVSALKGLGAYEVLVGDVIRPWMDATFGPDVANAPHAGTLRDAIVVLLEVVENTDIASLGLVGLVVLLYVVLVLLTTIERAFNQIWGVGRPRPILRKLTDYAAILFMAPIALLLTAVGSTRIDGLGAARLGFASEVAVLLTTVLVFAVLYVVMPYRRPRIGSAVLGAVVAAALWHVALSLHVRFQIGVARYNAIYSGFAAVPLFLVWVFVSWVIVLFGAELAAAHEDPSDYDDRIDPPRASFASRERAAIQMVVDVTRAFLAGEAPPSLSALATAADFPKPLAREVLATFVEGGVLAVVRSRGRQGYVLGRDPAGVTTFDLIMLLRGGERTEGTPGRSDDPPLAALYDAMAGSEANVTVRALAEKR